ncbi:MAG: hypothetical protein KC466_05595, partial [Myxococcales bacterium]|nr:hypothetical protein [Myxococcales bacterium]
EIDEGFDQLGSSCSNGFGACQGIGELVCDAAVEELACNAVRKGPEGVEIALSGLDEDCNPGTPDEAASQLEVVFVLQRIIRDLIPSLTPDVGYPTALLGGLTQP